MIHHSSAFSLEDVLKIHSELLRTGQGQALGRIGAIVLEAAKDAPVPVAAERHPAFGKRIDYYGQGPLLLLSPDQTTLLIQGSAIPPAEIPDPQWAPPVPTMEQLADPGYQRPSPQMVRQSLEVDFASGVWGQYLVVEPVVQILLRQLNRASWLLIKCETDSSGRSTALLVDPATGQGFLAFGKFSF